MDPDEFIIYCVVSVFASLFFAECRLPETVNVIAKVMAYFTILVYMFYRISATGWIMWNDNAPSYLGLVRATMYHAIKVLGVGLFILQIKRNLRRAAMTLIYCLIMYFSYANTGMYQLLELTAIIMLSDYFEKPRTTAYFYLGTILSFVIFMIFMNHAGVVENQEFQRHNTIVYTYGMGHTNHVGALMVLTLFVLWYLFLKRHYLISAVVFAAGAFLIWKITDSRTAALTALFFAVMNPIYSWIVRKKKEKAFKLFAFAPVFCMVISVVITKFMVPLLSGHVDDTFLMRFSFPLAALNEGSLQWMDNAVPIGSHILDNITWNMLIYFGIIPALLMTAIVTWQGICFEKNKQYDELMIFVAFCVYGMMETIPLMLFFNCVPVLVQGNLQMKQADGRTEGNLLKKAINKPGKYRNRKGSNDK